MFTTQSQKRDRKKSEIFFPDEITINILSRLPAKNALQCRLVCRRWRDLTSTLDFEQLHMKRSIPLILVAHPANFRSSIEHFLLDKWWEPERKRLVFHRFFVDSGSRAPSYYDEYWGLFSHGGLIVFEQRSRTNFVILNPASGENVRINLSEDLESSKIYGVFFHPLLKEYCTLWHDTDQGCYYMLNLGPKPYWREISNPWHRRAMVQGTCPVLIREYLYWLVKPEQENGCYGRGDILVFDIRSENFSLLHCPIPSDVNCVCSRINLLDIDGVLSFVLISKKEKLVNMTIWKLKDSAQQVWAPMNHSITVEEFSSYGTPLPTAIVGEQISLMFERRFYVCNLKLGTTRTFVKKKYNNPVETFSHVMSLASLKNCKSKISMDKDGLIDEDSDGTDPDSLSSTKRRASAYCLVRQGSKNKEHKEQRWSQDSKASESVTTPSNNLQTSD